MSGPTEYLDTETGPATFARKPPETRDVINEALRILDDLRIPVRGLPPRRMEREATAFLAVCDVDRPGGWASAKDATSGRSLRTRDIIKWQNERLSEQRSSGSYDDIRRKDLALLVMAGLVVNTKEGSARNDSTRGYALNPEHAVLIRTFGQPGWEDRVKTFQESHADLREDMARRRQ